MKKHRFSLHFRRLFFLILLVSLVLTLAGCSSVNNGQSDPSANLESSDDTDYGDNTENFGMRQCIDLALESLDYSREDVSKLHVEYDEDDDGSDPVFHVDFTADGYDYVFKIDAATGSILTFDSSESSDESSSESSESSSNESSSDASSDTSAESSGENSHDSNYIGVDKAKAIALQHAELSAQDVSFVKAKLSYDDGHHEYEIEFFTDSSEYEYEIDAHSGKILDWDHDSLDEDWDD